MRRSRRALHKQPSIDLIYERTTVFERGSNLEFLEHDCTSIQQDSPCALLSRPKATVIFWTADLRVTVSTRIVLVMTQAR
jgi:hypothetical protein